MHRCNKLDVKTLEDAAGSHTLRNAGPSDGKPTTLLAVPRSVVIRAGIGSSGSASFFASAAGVPMTASAAAANPPDWPGVPPGEAGVVAAWITPGLAQGARLESACECILK